MIDIDPSRSQHPFDGAPTRDAATVVLLRRAGAGFEVLLVERRRSVKFMGGACVFPGGKLDDADLTAARSSIEPTALTRVATSLGETEERARGLLYAAARETFEEAGVVLGASLALDRSAERSDRGSIDDWLARHGGTLALDRLVPLARWVTPTVEARRFDARFFAAEVRSDLEVGSDEGETVTARWFVPSTALEDHLAGRIDLPPPTLRTVEILAACSSIDEALAPTSRVPLVRPVFRDLEGQWILALPGDPEHPETAPVLPFATRFVHRDGRWFSG